MVTRSTLQHCLRILLTLLIFFQVAVADTPAPQFNLRSLDGQSFSNSSLSGDIVLLQFWTTWCPYCKSDQPAVDAIQSEYGGRRVVVIAVDVGEDEATVRQYLQKHPRSVSVALDENRGIAGRFGLGGFPHYVAIDRNGNIAASRSGAGGEQGLRYLVNRAEQPAAPKSAKTQTADRGTLPSAGGAGPQWTLVGGGQSLLPKKPIPKTIFVLANGEQLESDHYVIGAGSVDVTIAGDERHIALAALDTKKTIALNHARGVDLKLPTSKNEVFLGF